MLVLPELVVCPRLTLRRWRRADVARLRTAIEESTEHLRPWMSFIQFEPMSDDDRAALIEGWEHDWQPGGDVVYGMLVDNEVVGGCGLHQGAGPDTLEIGYWVHVDHIGNGYAREAVAHLTTAALALPGIARVEIHHDAANTASRRVPESLGFRLEGEKPDKRVAPSEIGVDVAWSTTGPTWAGTWAPRVCRPPPQAPRIA
ncbi:MAG TPA: GNAT family N-acetyltransferase [Actinobacteria bacterium]|jgi:RimJ/RimL family protein N-acetyltransferase|nr:GNAT family N-acetyltransferase [Actinomycetota bacterium]